MNNQERALKNAEFYFETVKSLKSDKLTSVLVESNLYTNREPSVINAPNS